MSQITDEQVEAALTAFYGAGAPHFDIHVRDDMRAALEAAAVLSTPPVGAETGEPVATWGNAETVGNLIAQLRTFDPATPVYGAFHADAGDGRKARVRGLTLSRERVNGRLIDTGNVTVPYAVVAWSAPQSDPEHTRSSPVSAEVTEEMVERACKKYSWARYGDTVIWPRDFSPQEIAEGRENMRAALVDALQLDKKG